MTDTTSPIRRAALIATAITLPLLIIGTALLVKLHPSGKSTNSTGSTPLPAVAVSPPPSNAATEAPCALAIGALPLTLNGANVRRAVSNPSSPFIVAWANPAIVLRCGVIKPARLRPSLSAELFDINDVLFLRDKQSTGSLWTIVDRRVFIDIFIPSSYDQPPLAPIATAIATVLKPTCTASALRGEPATPTRDQCTRRRR